jgi:hypothetical protein
MAPRAFVKIAKCMTTTSASLANATNYGVRCAFLFTTAMPADPRIWTASFCELHVCAAAGEIPTTTTRGMIATALRSV